MGNSRKWVWLAAAAFPLIVAGIVWAQRTPIAQSMLNEELAKRNVSARYVITRLGTKRQRIEDIVIGDPARPDLTAEWAEIDTSLRFSGATVTAIRAGGVRLRGRLVDGVVSFGSVDRLLPAPTGKPFALPSLDIEVSDGQLALVTPWGPVGVFAQGRGDLANAFKGAPTRFCVISFDSDWLYPTSESRIIVHALNASGAPVSFVELSSPFGHDSFFLELPELDRVIGGFLKAGAR